jgi:hypothetical protein
VVYKDLDGNISTELWESFREHNNVSVDDTLQTNMHLICMAHSLMKNAQNDETKESKNPKTVQIR